MGLKTRVYKTYKSYKSYGHEKIGILISRPWVEHAGADPGGRRWTHPRR